MPQARSLATTRCARPSAAHCGAWTLFAADAASEAHLRTLEIASLPIRRGTRLHQRGFRPRTGMETDRRGRLVPGAQLSTVEHR